MRRGWLAASVVAALVIAAAPSAEGLARAPATKVRVVKRVVPAADPGRFALEIGGVTRAAEVGDGGDTGPAQVEPGEVAVAERAVAPTTLSDYRSTIQCAASGGAGPPLDVLPNGAGEWAVQVSEGENALCTITNERVSETAPETVPLTLSRPQLRFGETGDRRTLQIDNPSAVGVAIHSLELGGADPGSFEIPSEDCGERELAPNRACRVVIAFRPTTAGTLRAALVILSGAEPRRSVVALTGRAAPTDLEGGGDEAGGARDPGGGAGERGSGNEGSGIGAGSAQGGAPRPAPAIPGPPESGPSVPGGPTPDIGAAGPSAAPSPEADRLEGRLPIAGVPALASLVDDGAAIPAPSRSRDREQRSSSAPPFSFAPAHLLSSGAGYVVLLLLLAMFPLTSVLGGGGDGPVDDEEGVGDS